MTVENASLGVAGDVHAARHAAGGQRRPGRPRRRLGRRTRRAGTRPGTELRPLPDPDRGSSPARVDGLRKLRPRPARASSPRRSPTGDRLRARPLEDVDHGVEVARRRPGRRRRCGAPAAGSIEYQAELAQLRARARLGRPRASTPAVVPRGAGGQRRAAARRRALVVGGGGGLRARARAGPRRPAARDAATILRMARACAMRESPGQSGRQSTNRGRHHDRARWTSSSPPPPTHERLRDRLAESRSSTRR